MTLATDFDPDSFITANVIDTCAVWNLLSSSVLHAAAFAAGVNACITEFVRYECLSKPRTNPTPEDSELQARARLAIASGQVSVHALDLEDLQEIDVLRSRKALGRGELASIVFAKKVNIAVMSDDRGATKFAKTILGNVSARSSTTPRLLGWLLFRRAVGKETVEVIIREHNEMKRPLEPHYRRMMEIVDHYHQVSGR